MSRTEFRYPRRVEFAETDPTPALLELGNAVITRTLSKAYGLAGLRVGYLLGPSDLVASIGGYGNPYPVSALSSAIAEARLDRPEDELTSFVDEVKRERIDLTGVLSGLGARPLPSEGNFVLAEVDALANYVISADFVEPFSANARDLKRQPRGPPWHVD